MEQQIEIEKTDKKNNLKFSFDGTGREDAVEILNRFVEDSNNKSFGRKVTISDVIAHALKKLNKKDISILQDQSMGLTDALRQKYIEEKGKFDSEDAFTKWLLTEYALRNKKKMVQ